jgi:hypothetical protein
MSTNFEHWQKTTSKTSGLQSCRCTFKIGIKDGYLTLWGEIIKSCHLKKNSVAEPDPKAYLGFWASRIRIRILPSSSKNLRKNLDFYCFVISLWLFIFEEWCKYTGVPHPHPDP